MVYRSWTRPPRRAAEGYPDLEVRVPYIKCASLTNDRPHPTKEGHVENADPCSALGDIWSTLHMRCREPECRGPGAQSSQHRPNIGSDRLRPNSNHGPDDLSRWRPEARGCKSGPAGHPNRLRRQPRPVSLTNPKSEPKPPWSSPSSPWVNSKMRGQTFGWFDSHRCNLDLFKCVSCGGP